MKIKVDECLPRELISDLRRYGHDAVSVQEESLSGSADSLVWKVSQKEQRFLITTDLDFSDVRRYEPGLHMGVLLIRLSQEGKNHVLAFIRWLLTEHDLNDWSRCLVVATDHKIRIRWPKSKIPQE